MHLNAEKRQWDLLKLITFLGSRGHKLICFLQSLLHEKLKFKLEARENKSVIPPPKFTELPKAIYGRPWDPLAPG